MKNGRQIQIKDYDERYRDQLLELHREIFLPIDGGAEKYISSRERVEKQIDALRTLIATKVDKLIGFSLCGRLENIPPYNDGSPCIEGIQNQLAWVACPHEKKLLEKHMAENQKEMGGKVIVRFYNNKFTRKKQRALDTDYDFTDLGVAPEYRRRGIGLELIKQTIKIARADNASAIFAACWGGGNSSRLCQKVGFRPFLTMGPSYHDGNAAKFMGKLLRHT